MCGTLKAVCYFLWCVYIGDCHKHSSKYWTMTLLGIFQTHPAEIISLFTDFHLQSHSRLHFRWKWWKNPRLNNLPLCQTWIRVTFVFPRFAPASFPMLFVIGQTDFGCTLRIKQYPCIGDSVDTIIVISFYRNQEKLWSDGPISS